MKAVERCLFERVKIVNTIPIISHLFFAKDSSVFFKATKDDFMQVHRCLQIYERASGQLVNYKSTLSFSPYTFSHAIDDIKCTFTVKVVQIHELYLGLPTFSCVHWK